jgi:anti-sigma factor RsiW
MQHLDVELAHRLIRGKLPVNDAAAWEQHLVICESCNRLVASERSWSNLLKLEQRSSEAEMLTPERVLPRLESLIPGEASRRRRRQRQLVVGCAACVALAGAAIVWRATTSTVAQRLAVEAGISEAQQARLVSNLDALLALRGDPWVAEEFSMVETFEKLLHDGARAQP